MFIIIMKHPANSYLYLCCAVSLLVCASGALLAAQADDNDDLRVSSNVFGGNFHSIAPKVNQGRPPEMANVIGKYLVAPHQAQAQTKAQTQDRGRNYNKYKAVNAPLRPTASSLTTAHQRNKWVSGEQPLDLDLDLDPTSTSNGCHWLALRNFGNLTLATGLVLVRDTNEQPVYFLSLRAFIKLNDGLYFPLRNFRAHPAGAYKLEFEDEQQQQLSSSQKTSASSASTGTSTGSQTSTNQRLVLNCSLANSNSNEQASNGGGPVARVSLMSAQRANRVFAEEITIQVSCGYLVLRLRGNGTYLVLVGIAFYQDGDAVASRTTTALRRQQQAPPPQKQINPTPSMRSEHLVFSTWPQAESGANQELPLIFMPSYSRYFCQSRVVLTGNNSVQLVLERFELMRLASGASSPESQRARRHARQAPGDSAATAATTTILYKSSPNAVTTCAQHLAGPGVPLSQMMDLTWLRPGSTGDGQGGNNNNQDNIKGKQPAAAAAYNRWLFGHGADSPQPLASSSAAPVQRGGRFLDLIVLGLGGLFSLWLAVGQQRQLQEEDDDDDEAFEALHF